MKTIFTIAILLTMGLLAMPGAFAQGVQGSQGKDSAAGRHSVLLSNAAGAGERVKGIGRLMRRSRCTASFIYSGDNKEAPAYVMTCGHCVQDWDPKKVFKDIPLEGYKMLFNYFIDTKDREDTVPVKRIVYSTMNGRDMAILELAATVGELEAKGIRPMKIAEPSVSKHMKEGAGVHYIGAPAGPLNKDSIYLRRSEGTYSGRANLLEYQWHFDGVYRTDLLDVYGGASGAPLFVNGEEGIIAVVNTTTIDGEGTKPCDMGCPCEVDKIGLSVRVNASYGIPVVGVGHCFDRMGLFNEKEQGCPLEAGATVQAVAGSERSEQSKK